MPDPSDPRVFFAALRTLLAWQRCSLALMAFGFVIERFSLFLTLLRLAPGNSPSHLFSLILGVVFIFLGVAVAIASTVDFRRFVRELPAQDVPSGSWAWLGSTINVGVALIGIVLAGFLVLTGF
jgi:putative membrane protein